MQINKLNFRLYACFEAIELANLLILKDFQVLLKIAATHPLKEAEKRVGELSERQAKLADSSELWTAIFGLHDVFNDDKVKICFLLKSDYNHNRDSISSVEDLILYKEDPPDVSILHRGNYYHFELKRYFKALNTDSLILFVKEKIFNYSEPYNFYITINSEASDELKLEMLRTVHETLKSLKPINFTGIIAFAFNHDNKDIYTVQVLPDFRVIKTPFAEGTKKIAKIFGGKK